METYNSPFSIDELLDALSSSHDSALGPDDIHYQMLKHLPLEVLNTPQLSQTLVSYMNVNTSNSAADSKHIHANSQLRHL